MLRKEIKMSEPEFPPIKYNKDDDCKYTVKITHKFEFKNEDVEF